MARWDHRIRSSGATYIHHIGAMEIDNFSIQKVQGIRRIRALRVDIDRVNISAAYQINDADDLGAGKLFQ